jgi:hypothetical protein
MTISDLASRPAADLVGWCHHCETWQRGRHARWVRLWWYPGWDWVCVNCDGEPWSLGVWSCRCVRCEPGESEYRDDECWESAHGRCADALCVSYDSECDGDHR